MSLHGLFESITERFVFLGSFPYAGRARDEDFGIGTRSFPVGEYVIVYCVEGQEVFILRGSKENATSKASIG